jgi:hypothetical protein
MDDRIDMPIVEIGFARRDRGEDLLDEKAQIGAQYRS